MSPVASIRLFEAEPDLVRYLSQEDRVQAAQVRLPTIELPTGALNLGATLMRWERSPASCSRAWSCSRCDSASTRA